jgi:hypothetical protein
MRAPSVAALLRTAGLIGTATGCVMAVASLSSPWAVDGPSAGHAADESGWQFLAYGDVGLVAACVFVMVLAVALCVGPRSRRVSRTAGSAAMALLLLALGGVALLWWLTGLDVSLFADDASARRFDPGPGFDHAAVGLLVAIVGVLVLLAGRWEARPRGARRPDAVAGPAEPSWLTPGSS